MRWAGRRRGRAGSGRGICHEGSAVALAASRYFVRLVHGGQPSAQGITTNYGYNPADQLCWTGAGTAGTATGVCPTTQPAGYAALTYDANGNLTNNAAVGALSYNTKNQTTAITNSSGTLAMAYADVDQTERASAGTTTFANGLLGLASQTAATALYFTRLPDGTLISMRQGTGGTSTNGYYTLDALGSVLAVTDAAGTTDTHTYTYEAFGRTITATGTTNPFRFASGYWDATTKLYKFGARYYDPRLGSWTQRDPVPGQLGNPGSTNRYTYTGCNPVNYTDPTGRSTDPISLIGACLESALTGAALGAIFGAFTIFGQAGAIAVGATYFCMAGIWSEAVLDYNLFVDPQGVLG